LDFRLDADPLGKNHHFSKEGFLTIKGSPTRVGVFLYYEPDGSVRRELRHPADVLRADCLASMGGKPITIASHPLQMLTPVNSENYQVGTSSNQVTVEYGPKIYTAYNFHRQDAIDAIVAKEYTEISLGYDTQVKPETGVFRGERYDFRQTNIINNHHSIIKTGRAGKDCGLRFDSIDEIPVDYESLAFATRFDGIPQKPQLFVMPKKEISMAKMMIAGVEYEVPDNLATAIRQDQLETERKDQFIEQLQGANQELLERIDEQTQALEAHLDTAKDAEDMDDEEDEDEAEFPPKKGKKMAKAEPKTDSVDAIRQQIRAEIEAEYAEKSAVETIRADAKFLLDHYDEIEFKFDSGMNSDQMRAHVLGVCQPNKKSRFDSADSAYVRGVYEAYIEARRDEIDAEAEEFREDSANQPGNISALQAQITASRLTAEKEQKDVVGRRDSNPRGLNQRELDREQAWNRSKSA
jgi:hypothetical protein